MPEIKESLPPQVRKGMEKLVSEGWFKTEAELVEEAVRRYLESHPLDLMERYVKQDIEWGLHGSD